MSVESDRDSIWFVLLRSDNKHAHAPRCQQNQSLNATNQVLVTSCLSARNRSADS